MQCIPRLRQTFLKLWTVWIIILAIILTLADIFLSDWMTSFLTPLQSQWLRLALMVAALIARSLVQPALKDLEEAEMQDGFSSKDQDRQSPCGRTR